MKNYSLKNRITVLTAATGAMLMFPAFIQTPLSAVESTVERPMMRPFNPATVQTIKGTVAAVNKVETAGRVHFGVHLVVKTDKGPFEVHLGPPFFLDQNNFKVPQNDAIEVTGSLVSDGSKSFIIASEIKSGDKTLKLRDAQGLPLWRGGALRVDGN